MIRVNWKNIAKVLRFVATVITTVLGTIAVHAILPPIDLSMTSDTKMWIRGTNGLGKTTLLKTLMHKLPAISGTFDFHLQTKINYVEQDLEFRTKSISATTFMNETFPKMSAKEIRSELAKVGLRGSLNLKSLKIIHIETTISGERARTVSFQTTGCLTS